MSMPMYVPVRPIPAEQCTTIGDFGLVASVAMYLDDVAQHWSGIGIEIGDTKPDFVQAYNEVSAHTAIVLEGVL